MKTRIWLLPVLLLVLILAACQPAALSTPAPSTPAPAENLAAPTGTAAQQNQAVPATQAQGVPYPGQQNEVQAQPQTTQAAQPASPYPAPGEPKTVAWADAEAAILKGDVIQIDQAKDLKVTLILKDGSTLITTEPAFDEVVRARQRCGDPCKNIMLYSVTQ